MPELPEVETVRRRLAAKLTGKKILKAEVFWDRTIDRPSAKEFKRILPGHKIVSIKRRGKYLLFELAPKRFLLAHLRMSGDLLISPSSIKVSKHVRSELHFSGGLSLQFEDTRKFGRMYLVSDADEIVGKIGPEPLGEEFSSELFFKMLKSKKGAIKPLLLNQTFLAGLGNIYVVESLWRAKIHPLKRAHKISASEARSLFKVIRDILSEAIKNSGTDIGDGVWEAGGYRTRVYGRAGKPCLRCKIPIKRIVVGQRGTEFCPTCQRR